MSDFKLFLEGVYEWETTVIVREIIKLFKKHYLGGNVCFYYGDNIKGIVGKLCKKLNLESLNLNVGIYVNISTDSTSYIHGGGALHLGSEYGDFIRINFGIPVNVNISELHGELVRTVRHELEHVDQYKKNRTDIPKITDMSIGIKEYFLTDIEIEAYVSALYKRAKAMKKPLSSVLTRWIYNIEDLMDRSGKYSQQEIREIIKEMRKKYSEYARKRFPKATLGGRKQWGTETNIAGNISGNVPSN